MHNGRLSAWRIAICLLAASGLAVSVVYADCDNCDDPGRLPLRIVSIADASNQIIETFTYAAGQVTRSAGPPGAARLESVYVLDASGRAIGVTRTPTAAGRGGEARTETFYYDQDGRYLGTLSGGCGCGGGRNTFAYRDPRNRIIRVTTAAATEGERVTLDEYHYRDDYDAASGQFVDMLGDDRIDDRLTEHWKRSAAGTLELVEQRDYEDDPSGSYVVTVRRPVAPGWEQVVREWHDTDGRMTSQEYYEDLAEAGGDPPAAGGGYRTNFEYSRLLTPGGSLRGETRSTVHPDGFTDVSSWEIESGYSFGEEGSTQTVRSYRANASAARINERVETRSYVPEYGGYRTDSVTEPGGAVTTFEYDPVYPQRILRQTRSAPGGLPGSTGYGVPSETAYSYDAAGRVTLETRNGPNAADIETGYEFDIHGRLTKRTESAGTLLARSQEYRYNAFDEQILSRDAAGLLRASIYDQNGQLIEEYACAFSGALDDFDPLAPPPDSLYEQTQYSHHPLSGRVTVERTLVTEVVPFSRDAGTFVERTSTYDSTGIWLLSSREPGQLAETAYEYDPQGRVTATISPTGVVTRSHLDGRGLAAVKTVGTMSEEWLFTEFKYNSDGQLQQTINPDWTLLYYNYDDFGRQTSVESGSMDSTSPVTYTYTVYDAAGRVTRTYSPGVSDTVSDYDTYGRVWRQRRRAALGSNNNAEDQVVLTGYDAAGNVEVNVGKVDADPSAWSEGVDQVTRYTYTDLNDEGSVTLVNVDATGQIRNEVTRFEYDGAGRRTAEVVAPSGAGGLNLRTTIVSDTTGRVVKVIDPAGQYVEQTYDSRGQLVRRTSYEDQDGDGAGGTARMQERWIYDQRGQVTEQDVMADATSMAAAAREVDQVTRYQYDDEGRLEYTWTYRNGTSVASIGWNTYDAIGRLAIQADGMGNRTTQTYDPATGLITARELAENVKHTTRTQLFEYDGRGRLTRETWDDDLPRSTAYTYDLANRVASVTDAEGSVTQYEYDLLGQQSAVHEELGRNTLYAYDRLGRLTQYSVEDTKAEEASQKTDYGYDLAGRRTRIVFPDCVDFENDVVRYAYDVAGRLTAMTDQRGVTSAYVPDSRGLLISRQTSSITPTVADTFEYDGLGRRTRARRLQGGVEVSDVVSAYTDLGHLDFEKQKLFGAASAEHLEYTTDQRGNVHNLQYPLAANVSLSFVYDNIDRVQTVMRNSVDLVTYLRSGFDDDVERTIRLGHKPEAPTLRYHYALSQNRRYLDITNEVNPGGGNVVSASFLDMDAVGNRFLKRDAGRTAFDQTVSYTHDELHRLIGADYSNGGEVFQYDILGNRIGQTEGGYGYVDTRQDGASQAFDYSPNNAANEYPKINGLPLRYDPAGNLTSDERGLGYAYDFENRLIKVFTDADGDGVHDAGETALAEFVYDALGRRIQGTQYDGGTYVTTRYVYDGQRVIAEYDGTMQLKRYFIDGALYIDEHLLFVDKTGTEDREYYYLLKDLYTVAGLVDESGEVVEGYAYDAYGQVRMYRVEGQIADADRDGDVDIADFESVQRCFSGDGTAIPAGCSAEEITQLDVDGDDDIDEQDMSQFLDCWQGPAWAIRATGDYDEDGWVTADLAGGLSDVENFVLCTQKNLPQDPQCDVFDFDGNGNIDLYDYGTLAGLVGYPAGTPWGGCVVAQAESRIGNPYFFTGQRLDLLERPGMPIMVPAQVYHYRARWYDPVHGRFGQRDPSGYVDSISLYEYVQSLPTTGVDPSGEIRDENLPGYYPQPGEYGYDVFPREAHESYMEAMAQYQRRKTAALAALTALENEHKQYAYFRLTGLDRTLQSLRANVNAMDALNFRDNPTEGAEASYQPQNWYGGGGYFRLPEVIRQNTMFHEAIHLHHDVIGRFRDSRQDEGITHAAEGILRVLYQFATIETAIWAPASPDDTIKRRWSSKGGMWFSVQSIIGAPGRHGDYFRKDFTVTSDDLGNLRQSLGFHISCEELAEAYNNALWWHRKNGRSCITLVCDPAIIAVLGEPPVVKPPFALDPAFR